MSPHYAMSGKLPVVPRFPQLLDSAGKADLSNLGGEKTDAGTTEPGWAASTIALHAALGRGWQGRSRYSLAAAPLAVPTVTRQQLWRSAPPLPLSLQAGGSGGGLFSDGEGWGIRLHPCVVEFGGWGGGCRVDSGVPSAIRACGARCVMA